MPIDSAYAKGVLSWKDWAIALVSGVVIVALLTLFPYPWPHPLVWDDMAAAAGVRSPEAIMPGLGRAVLIGVYHIFGTDAAHAVVLWGGRLAAGIIAIFTWMLLNESLPDLLRRRMRLVGWGREVVRRILVLGVFFFMCNEAVWRASQTLSTTTIHLLLLLPACWCVVRFLITEKMWCVYSAMVLWGFLAGDSPLGGVVGIVAETLIWWKSFSVEDMTTNPIGNPLVRLSMQRRMTVVFIVSALAVVAFNSWSYLHCGGIFDPDSNVLDVMLRYLTEYVHAVTSSMTGIGWLFTALFAVAPLVVAYICVGAAIVDDKFIPFRYGLLFLALGILAWTQVCGFSPLWFRSWAALTIPVKSEMAIAVTGFLSTLTLVWSLSVLGVDVYFRDFRRITQYRFQDAAETEVGNREVSLIVRFNRLSQILVWLMPVILLLTVVPMRRQKLVRQMLGVVGDFCLETVRECGDVKWLFTDGTFDAAIELLARRDGRTLYCLNMMGTQDPRDIALRQRGVLDAEDRTALETGAPDTLRTWLFDKPIRHSQFAVQVGIELWKKHSGLKPPIYSGVLVRPMGMSSEVLEASITRTHALEERILDLYYKKGSPGRVGDVFVRSLFAFAQWRLARMSRVRSNEYAAANQQTMAEKEHLFAIELDANNPELKRIKRSMDWITTQRGTRLTPREGLKIALDRADFKMAQSFAENILRADPDDAAANFAIGMGNFFDEQYGRAAVHLKRVLVRRPTDPSVLNNLAVTMMRLERYEEAVDYAEKAVRVAPKAAELKRSLEMAKQLRDEAQRKKKLLTK